MKILITRFSALGDVAMTIPSIWALANEYPNLDITVLSAPNTESLFCKLPKNVHFKGADFKKRYKAFPGLNRLTKELIAEKYDYVADLHDVLRSKYIRRALKINGSKVAYIDKGRKEKRKLTREGHTRHPELISSFARYAIVFSKLGFNIDNNTFKGFSNIALPLDFYEKKEDEQYIGIAPFAKHSGKIYPLGTMKNVITMLASRPKTQIFLFGFGKEENDYFNDCCKIGDNIHNLAGKYKMLDEIAIMQTLDVMLSMDSANMHLASLVGTKVVSVWGATHSHAGFMGWKQCHSNKVELPLECRPCSVFGDKKCKFNDYRCMSGIKEQDIVNKITETIAEKNELCNKAKENDITEWCNNIHENFEKSGEVIHNGRNQIRVYDLGLNTRINVKRYKIPIFINRIIYTFIRKSKCERAYIYSNKLKSLGISTPEAISYKIIRKYGMIETSYLITKQEDNMRMFFEFGTGGTKGKEHIVRALANFVADMHKKGVLHKDLSCGNVLFKEEEDGRCYFILVDINRMEFRAVDKRTGCANFARIWGNTEFFSILAEEYAKTMGYNKEECKRLVLYYRAQFWKNREKPFSEI